MTRVLIVVDAQNDFVSPKGSLAAPSGESPLPFINALIADEEKFGWVVKSRDWHPRGHVSFCEQGGPWPAHAVQNTWGAMFHPDLLCRRMEVTVSKGSSQNCDSASAFGAAGLDETGLAHWCGQMQISEIHVCGYVTEVCVLATALDAIARTSARVCVVWNACAPLSAEGAARAREQLLAAGAVIIDDVAC